MDEKQYGLKTPLIADMGSIWLCEDAGAGAGELRIKAFPNRAAAEEFAQPPFWSNYIVTEIPEDLLGKTYS